jgi:hypothetical protein
MKTIAADIRSIFNGEDGSLKLRKAFEVSTLGAGDRITTAHGVFQLENTAGRDYWNLIPVAKDPAVAPITTAITAKNFHQRAADLTPRERITLARELGII